MIYSFYRHLSLHHGMEITREATSETQSYRHISRHTLEKHIVGNDLEIMVTIDGTESVTSNTLQARYSYTADDIEFNAIFRPCVSIDEQKGAVIDFNKFHDLIPLDPRVDYNEDIYIQSII